MINLPNGCRYTGLKVTPQNWEQKDASTDVDWRIYYTFYDAMGTPKQVVLKRGLNYAKDLKTRRDALRTFLEGYRADLEEKGYNPITDSFTLALEQQYSIEPTTGLIPALKFALDRLEGVTGTKQDAKSVLKYTSKAARRIGYYEKPICQVSKKHIRILLDFMKDHFKELMDKKDTSSPEFSNKKYNRYRANLVMLFKVLEELEVVGANPVHGVKRKKVVKEKRLTLTAEERRDVNKFLKKENPAFHRFVHIFFHSGSRETELMSVKGKDVDLAGQKYSCLVKKGAGGYEVVERTIKDMVLPLWREALKDCAPNDYIFSKGLLPGSVQISSSQITRRWKRWIKDKLDIKADFYSLKHLHSSEIVDQFGMEAAAYQNSHKSTDMVAKVYDIKSKDRHHHQVKVAKNAFA